MLTEEQKSKLIEITNSCKNEKLKIILCKAIPLWISSEVKPCQRSFGLSTVKGVYQSAHGSACLLGCALIGEPCKNESYDDSEEYFNLSYKEIDQIVWTFDKKLEADQEEFTVSQIRKVLFGE